MSNAPIPTNYGKLVTAFTTALVISADEIHDGLAYNSIKEWDSTAHMMLIVELENSFNVMLDTDDIIDMSSVAKTKEILNKYGVQF